MDMVVPRGDDRDGVQRFAVDRMLGRLARWLRVLGHDVAYGPHLGRATLAACARRERRLLLTRDTRLVRPRAHPPPYIFITSDHFREQLQQVAAVVPIGRGPFLGRCLACNRPLERVTRERVEGQVPAYVFATAAHFARCARCGRVYWPATHQDHMRRELEHLGLLDEGA